MPAVFADTSFFVAVLNRDDAIHGRARAAAAALTDEMVTTEYVLLEVATFFTKAVRRQKFIELLESLRTAEEIIVVPGTPDLFARGAELFAARPDKEWSLTDCTSFVVMQDRGLTDALTAGYHFAQAGFRPLLA